MTRAGTWSLNRSLEWARCLGASPPKRMTASWSGSRVGATEYKVAARSSRAMAGSPRIVGEQPGYRGSTAASLNRRAQSRGVPHITLGNGGHTIPLRNGELSMPQGRQPTGEHALSNAERQARYRARRQVEQPLPKIRYRRPADRRTRAQRWCDTVAELVTLQAE